MPGMRGEDEILKAFEGLDRAPGSKQPRRQPTGLSDKRRAKILGESNGWDANPVIKTLKGKETEVFTIAALAEALEKKVVTIRLWEKKGYIPIAPYRLRSKTLNGKKVNGNRVYTRDLIEIAIEEFSKRGLLGSARVEWNRQEDLTDAIVKRWKESLDN
ncbi:hypothetical protein UFOVP223_121 [uncultured Caudovirales phage]|uniref:HTH merR-type domain-containing protein n=1 Tax=uncultured Caudovirales phage TaxID=2100421 RepID=A0A6J7WPL0_9CAUD|nr:hypothetical protein UFOVP110_43 [uncultured Caudovirales phage]CAB5219710.1 hypothetical protein UFOVP223_121 [uncultured Caudovirales phage]